MYVSYASQPDGARQRVPQLRQRREHLPHVLQRRRVVHGRLRLRNYTVENNVFEQPCNNRSAPCGGRLDGASGFGHCNIYGGTDLTNVKLRFNTFVGGSTFDLDNVCTQASGNGLQIVGNLMKRTSTTCGVGWTPEYVVYNVYSGSGTCGSERAQRRRRPQHA